MICTYTCLRHGLSALCSTIAHWSFGCHSKSFCSTVQCCGQSPCGVRASTSCLARIPCSSCCAAALFVPCPAFHPIPLRRLLSLANCSAHRCHSPASGLMTLRTNPGIRKTVSARSKVHRVHGRRVRVGEGGRASILYRIPPCRQPPQPYLSPPLCTHTYPRRGVRRRNMHLPTAYSDARALCLQRYGSACCRCAFCMWQLIMQST